MLDDIAPSGQTMQTSALIHCSGVASTARGAIALKNISCDIYAGEIFMIAGYAGSGKSLLLKILAGQVPYSGMVTVQNRPLEDSVIPLQTYLNYLPQENDTPDFITPREFMAIQGGLRGMKPKAIRDAINDLTDKFTMTDFARKPFRLLSPAQRQISRSAAALMGYPQILILDDPMRDCDAEQRAVFWDLIDSLRRETNITTLFATQHIDEAQRIITRAAILRAGSLMTVGALDELAEKYHVQAHIDITLTASSALTEPMRQKLQKIGEIAERDPLSFSLFPNTRIPTIAIPKSRKNKKNDNAADSWLLDSVSMPGALGKCIDDILSILGRENIAQMWLAPPSFSDILRSAVQSGNEG